MRRRTVVWTLVVLVLVVPLLVLAGGWWYLRSGRLERAIERAFAHRLPGQLRIGALHLSLGAAVLEDVDIYEPGQDAMARIKRVTIELSYHRLSPHLERISLDSVHLRLDRRSWDLLNALIDAEDRYPSSGNPRDIPITANGDLDIAGKAHIEDIAVDAHTLGPDTKADANATLAKRPFHVFIHIHPDGTRRVMEIKSDEPKEPLQTLPLLPVLDGLSAIGIMAPLPDTLRRYLPTDVDGRGTDVVHDLKADSWSGPMVGHWPGGSISGNLNADVHVIHLLRLSLADPVRLTAEGQLAVDIDNDQLQLDCVRWTPGTILPFPAEVPLAAILPVVPQAALTFGWHNDVLKVHCVATAPSPSQAQMVVDWTSGKPVNVTGATLPLVLAQTFVPDHVVIDDGIASHFDLAIGEHGIASCNVDAVQARMGAFGWTVGDLDGAVSILPGAGEALVINASLTRPTHVAGRTEVVHVGDVSYAEHAGGGVYRFRLARVEDLLIRMHGPFGLPDLHGALDLDLDLTASPGRLKGVIQSMAIESMAMPDLLQNCGATIKGDFVWQDHSVTTTLRGQLKHGQVRLPGTWLDVASNTPIFTTTVS